MALIRKLKSKEDEEYLQPVRIVEKKKGYDHDESNWLISYADMMTLLAIFYIMLFSMSKMNTPDFEKMKKEVSTAMGGKYVSPTEDVGKFINNVLVEAGVQKDATMTSDGVGVSIAFHSTLFFDSMSAEISPAGKEILQKIISGIALKQKESGKPYKIVVEGHTDSQPILSGPFPSNWELSSGRATRVIRMFLDQPFSSENLLAIGYADTQPVAESRNQDGSWNQENLAKNRRVILRVLMPDVDSIPWKSKPQEAGPERSTASESAPVIPVGK